ncbi:helix-turn-helix domain-containing protein [Cohnella thermotolerans]|uniref:helix-turn-helix domain-containing protein n=1 Tax=Cohnella thermotolerans TaxID=329858 RepID=UPI000684998C|nr:helix-turn-helix domain-containing protein [Cohnella thermotolerans]
MFSLQINSTKVAQIPCGIRIFCSFSKPYLLTPQQAAEALGISKVTLNKYIKQGLECLDNKSHKKIPAYTVEIMKDPVYSILMQKTAQEKKLRNQTPKERLAEINSEIAELQLKYGKETVDEAFDGYNGDEMNDPVDYYLWQDLEKEKREIIKMSGGKKT